MNGNLEWLRQDNNKSSRKPEQVSTDELKDLLGRHFIIEEQVHGRHFASKAKKRLDMVIRPRDTSGWMNKSVAFGVEIKKHHGETGDHCRHIGQSCDYANTEWDGFGFIYILTYPSIIPSWISDAGFVHRMAGRLGVGVIENSPLNGASILINEHMIWSENTSVVDGRHWKLERKFGSR